VAEQLVNSAASTLTAAIPDAVATSCTVANGTVFPATGNFRIIIDSELLLCTARTGNTLTVTRGVEATTAASHANGAAVTHVLTKGGLDQYLAEKYPPAPAARVFHSAAQTLTTSVALPLAFDSERFDTDNIHDTVTNNSRLTCRTAGKYQITANAQWPANGTGIRILQIRINGGTVIATTRVAGNATYGNELNLSALWDMAVNDYVDVLAFQDSGGNLNVAASASFSPEFSMVRVG
jgi:hypothetical protein